MNDYLQLEYSANLTSNSFLLFESIETARLLVSGLSWDECKAQIDAENLYNYTSRKWISQKFNAIKRRFLRLNADLITLIAQGDHSTAALTTLYAIFKHEPIFGEFLTEVFLEKGRRSGKALGPADLHLFLNEKATLDSRVAAWKDSTRKKLWDVFRRILVKAGLMDRSGMAIRQIMDSGLKDILIALDEYQFTKCVEGF
ncbi:MAG: hypothetical protein CVV64_11915 [Candidatus Wallbacteria bacterium HGW-Wallbacteria-1]|jgi:hypothetical protein|uniref:DUF1819 domain-containing protein n=1 Tax=Candidatus Wallbacteria bacterium HGW-Wallbacteria-1 TaxID=2013854 RepID=A0A2N1PNX0_9BACT|nr:MAG: hypothetical protein CVV64_11915 [Candidatus Wallbacteria bacterium HGW-Wallbacteria-1]